MKKKEVVKKLKRAGWWKKREGGNHEVWTNGEMSHILSRHNNIPDKTPKSIIKKAINNPAK